MCVVAPGNPNQRQAKRERAQTTLPDVCHLLLHSLKPSLNSWNTFNLPSIWYKTAICLLPYLLIFLPPLCRTIVLHHSSFLFFLNLAIVAPHHWQTGGEGGETNKNSLQLYVLGHQCRESRDRKLFFTLDGIPRWHFVMLYLPKYKRGVQECIFAAFLFLSLHGDTSLALNDIFVM